MTPFVFIRKEVERRAQEGEDVSGLENNGPIKYHRNQTAKTRAADAGLVLEHDVIHFGSSCESPGHLNMPFSDSLTVSASTPLRAQGWQRQLRSLGDGALRGHRNQVSN